MNVLLFRSIAVVAFASLIVLPIISRVSDAGELKAGPSVPLLAGPSGPQTLVVAPTAKAPQPEAATFVVTYIGFPAAAKTAFQRAVNIWATQITSAVPVTIQARYTPLGPGILGSAGAGTFARNFPGLVPGFWYPEALANKKSGRQLASGVPDIVASFSSSFPNWHFGPGPAPAGKYDFTTVVMHEIGHGLGFLGGGRVAGALGFIRASGPPAFPFIYDRFTENGPGTALLALPDPSAALSAQLRGNNLFFDIPPNGGLRAKLYAPNPFRSGSSYSHLDEGTYLRGNVNSLMTPILGLAETILSPGPLTTAIFKAMGW